MKFHDVSLFFTMQKTLEGVSTNKRENKNIPIVILYERPITVCSNLVL